MTAPLDLTLTADARQHALAHLADTSVENPVLCLMKGRVTGESEDQWRWGIYGPDNIKYLTEEFARLEHQLLYEFEGLLVAIPQVQFVPQLIGKTLSVGDGHGVLTVHARSGGA